MKEIKTKTKENPKLMQRVLADGRISLYLEYYDGYSYEINPDGGDGSSPKMKLKRHKETLGLYLNPKPRTIQERNENKETLAIAEEIRREREQEVMMLKSGHRLSSRSSVDLLVFFDTFIEKYCKADQRQLRHALNRFRRFLVEEKGYDLDQGFSLKHFNRELMQSFVNHLILNGTGEGPKDIFRRFKRLTKQAVESGVLKENPCDGLHITADTSTLRKDVLSWDEVIQLISCHYDRENPDIRKAFILSLYCGIRFCDVKRLTYANVDYGNKLIRFTQAKTNGHSSASGVIMPISDELIEMIGNPEDGNLDKLLFALPSHTMCLKALRHWTKRAGITKHITWHCARHTFAVNLLNNGANIKTLQSLLGHSSMKCTEIYLRAVDSLKRDAVNSLSLPENLS